MDCVNGVVYKVVLEVFWEMGVEVVFVGVLLNGFNINDKCGLIYLVIISEVVVCYNVYVGILFDGDVDCVMIVDEVGMVVDGD